MIEFYFDLFMSWIRPVLAKLAAGEMIHKFEVMNLGGRVMALEETQPLSFVEFKQGVKKESGSYNSLEYKFSRKYIIRDEHGEETGVNIACIQRCISKDDLEHYIGIDSQYELELLRKMYEQYLDLVLRNNVIKTS